MFRKTADRQRFHPETRTVNADREYYISDNGSLFEKHDTNVERGMHEAEMLRVFSPMCTCLPRYIASEVRGGLHVLWMERIRGTSLENLRGLSVEEKYVLKDTMRDAVDMIYGVALVHKDLNESNVLYNSSAGEVHFIDLETAEDMMGRHSREDYGEDGGRYGLPYLFAYIEECC